MLHIEHHPHPPRHALLREADYYMPGHGLGAHTGHESQSGRTVDMFRIAFWFSLLLTVPVLIWDPAMQAMFGYQVEDFIGVGLTPALFTLAVYYYGGQIFLRGAYRELRAHQPGMMVLIALATSLAFLYSVMVLFGLPGRALWSQLSLLITLLLFGNWLDLRAITRAERMFQELATSLPEPVLRLSGEREAIEVQLDELRPGDRLVIPPGEIIPADGLVLRGTSEVDESMLTGAAAARAKQPGDEIFAGSRNGAETLHIEVTTSGDETLLGKIMHQLETVLHARSRMQAQTDSAAYALTLITLATAVVTLLLWQMLEASLEFSITRLIAVLVVAAPQAVGLALPLVFSLATAVALRHGLLLRDRRALDEAHTVNLVIFASDTLSDSALRVVETISAGSLSPHEALRLAATVEYDSSHPFAQALRSAVHDSDLPQQPFDIQNLADGVQASVDGRALLVCGAAHLQQQNIVLSEMLAQAAQRFEARGYRIGYLVEEQQPLAVFAFAVEARAEAQQAIRQIHKQGIEVALFSEAPESSHSYLADELGIDRVFHLVTAEEQARKICQLQEQGKRIALVGSATSQEAAMMAADVSIALGAATEGESAASDVTTFRRDPRDIARLITLSKATYQKSVQNIGWASAYNVIAIPLAAGVLAGSGVLLSPVASAILMTASTALVAINAQRLCQLKL